MLPSFRLCRNRGVFIQNKGFRSALVCNNPSVSFHSTAPLAQGSLFGILRLRRRQRFVQTKGSLLFGFAETEGYLFKIRLFAVL